VNGEHLKDFLALRRNTVLLLGALVLAGTGERLWLGLAPKYLEPLGVTVIRGDDKISKPFVFSWVLASQSCLVKVREAGYSMNLNSIRIWSWGQTAVTLASAKMNANSVFIVD
jgi:hypothetical protein